MPIACAITPSPSSARPMDVEVSCSSLPPRPASTSTGALPGNPAMPTAERTWQQFGQLLGQLGIKASSSAANLSRSALTSGRTTPCLHVAEKISYGV